MDINLTTDEQLQIVGNRLKQYEAQRFDQQLNLKLYDAMPPEMRNSQEKRQFELAIEQLDKMIAATLSIYENLRGSALPHTNGKSTSRKH